MSPQQRARGAYVPRTFAAFRLSLSALLTQAIGDEPALRSPELEDAIERLDDVTWEGCDEILRAAWFAYECAASERGELPRGCFWERELSGVSTAYDRGYGVLRWDQPSPTVAGGSNVGQGAYAVADPRLTCEPRRGSYGVLAWDRPARTVTGSHQIDNGPAAVADTRVTEAAGLEGVDWSSRRPADRPPVLIARDGTWHRPLTLLDLAALQGLPATIDGRPLDLAGPSLSAVRTRIGNAVPVGAAKAIAEKKLATLLGSDLGSFSLSSDAVWVESPDALEPGRVELAS